MKHSFDEQQLWDLIAEWGNQKYGAISQIEAVNSFIDATIIQAQKEILEKVRHCTDGCLPRGEHQRGFDNACDIVADFIDAEIALLEQESSDHPANEEK